MDLLQAAFIVFRLYLTSPLGEVGRGLKRAYAMRE